MQKGQKVKVVRTNSDYLTVGKTYPVLAGCGDTNLSAATKSIIPVLKRNCFNVITDGGTPILCEHPHCAHAEWELVQE
ncbi:MAG: hypothetical protein ACRC8W_04100 [Plesiomonas shigelloides]